MVTPTSSMRRSRARRAPFAFVIAMRRENLGPPPSSPSAHAFSVMSSAFGDERSDETALYPLPVNVGAPVYQTSSQPASSFDRSKSAQNACALPSCVHQVSGGFGG